MTNMEKQAIRDGDGRFLLEMYRTYFMVLQRDIVNEDAGEIYEAVTQEILKRCDSYKED